jgi:hypothetical protein
MSSKPNSDNIESELQRKDTSGSVLMTKDLFEKLYLSPETKVAGDLRKRFANPTPLYVQHRGDILVWSANYVLT